MITTLLASSAILAFLGVFVAAVINGAVALIKSRKEARTAERVAEIEAAPAEDAGLVALVNALQTRLARVEARVDELNEHLDTANARFRAAVGYVDRLLRWIRYGADEGEPRPTPPDSIRSYLDPNNFPKE